MLSADEAGFNEMIDGPTILIAGYKPEFRRRSLPGRKGYQSIAVRSDPDGNSKPNPDTIAGITSTARFRHRYERSRDMCLHRLNERLLRR